MFIKFKQIIIAALATAIVVAAFILMISYPVVSFMILAAIGVILIFAIFYNTVGEVLNRRETEAEKKRRELKEGLKETRENYKKVICDGIRK